MAALSPIRRLLLFAGASTRRQKMRKPCKERACFLGGRQLSTAQLCVIGPTVKFKGALGSTLCDSNIQFVYVLMCVKHRKWR